MVIGIMLLSSRKGKTENVRRLEQNNSFCCALEFHTSPQERVKREER